MPTPLKKTLSAGEAEKLAGRLRDSAQQAETDANQAARRANDDATLIADLKRYLEMAEEAVNQARTAPARFDERFGDAAVQDAIRIIGLSGNDVSAGSGIHAATFTRLADLLAVQSKRDEIITAHIQGILDFGFRNLDGWVKDHGELVERYGIALPKRPDVGDIFQPVFRSPAGS